MKINRDKLIDFFEDKTVLILGSAPSVVELKADFMESFDIIVRLNNYKFFNKCKRTDVFYSYFGNNIKKTVNDIWQDNVKLILCKYPNADFREHSDGKHQQGIAVDCRETYKTRGDYFDKTGIKYFVPDINSFKINYQLFSRIPTTGMAAILDIHKLMPKYVHVAGFDFFSSGIHNIDESWKQGDGNHNLIAEKRIFDYMVKHNHITCEGYV